MRQYAIYLAIIAACVAFSQCQGWDDEQVDMNIYCENVDNGNWPDYKELKDECRKRRTPMDSHIQPQHYRSL